jgi:hypothetical protein
LFFCFVFWLFLFVVLFGNPRKIQIYAKLFSFRSKEPAAAAASAESTAAAKPTAKPTAGTAAVAEPVAKV